MLVLKRTENKLMEKRLFDEALINSVKCVSVEVGDEEGVEWDQIGGARELIDELKDRVILPLRLQGELRDTVVS